MFRIVLGAAAVLALGLGLLAEPANATRSLPAFPGAEGAGAFAVGGRGGEVYRVTNLNADGPGSLADAVSRPGRIVVFTVSGIIDLARDGKGGKLIVAQPNITIAGQTAPGEGICLRGGSLEITADDVIVRHLRVRRGFISEGERGDAVNALGDTSAMEHVLLDHLSASWATDETITSYGRINHTTIQHCLISEGLDYENPRQTPKNHGFGSIWGCGADDGRVSMHHTLYAHQGMRAPRVVAGGTPPAVMDFRNNVVYDCARYAGHTGKDAVRLNWINNYYKDGPSTRPELRGVMFTFFNNPASRMFARGNVIEGDAEGTADNWRAVRFERRLSPDDAMRVATAYPAPAVRTQTAPDAFATVLMEAGATLPARDAVDLRVTEDVRHGTGRVIGKETDLAPDQRWPDYRSLPPPADTDADGMPDFWEEEHGLNPRDARDAMALSGGYANIEHYFNNTTPRSDSTPVVYMSASVSRARPGQPGEFRIVRTGPADGPLTVRYSVAGTAEPDRDVAALSGVVTLARGARSAVLPVPLAAMARHDRTIVVSLASDRAYHRGCPATALVVTIIPTAASP